MTTTATGDLGVYTLTARYTTSGPLNHTPTGSVDFQDTSYSNAVLASAPWTTSTIASTLERTKITEDPSYPYATFPYATFGDFNGDGKQDIISGASTSLIIKRGNGDGTFRPYEAISTTLTGIAGLVSGDFNGDGKMDVIARTDTSTSYVLLGNGNATFQSPVALAVAVWSTADFNGDGKLDLYTYEICCVDATVLIGNGDGTFGSPQSVSQGLIGDFNGDGRADIRGYLTLSLGQSNGTFVTTNVPAFSPTYLGAAGDFNGDGKADATDGTSLYIGKGDGTFQVTQTLDINPDPSVFTAHPDRPLVADFNGDGYQDLAYVGDYALDKWSAINGPWYQYAEVFFGRADGTLSQKSVVLYGPSSGGAPNFSGAADFNGDGVPDLIGNSYRENSIYTAVTTLTATAAANNVRIMPAGFHRVRASYSGDANFAAATSPGVLVEGTDLTTTYLTLSATPNPANVGSPVSLVASLAPYKNQIHSTNGESITFYDGGTLIGSGTLSEGIATTAVSTLTAGTHSITALFGADTEFKSSTSAPVSLQVDLVPVSVSWSTPAAITYGRSLSSAQLNATTGVDGNFVYTPALGSVLSAGTHTLNVSFTPTDTAKYSTASASVTLTVDKATPSITWAAPAAISYGTTLSATQLNATSGTPGVFVYTPALGAELPAGTHTLSVSFTPTDTANYNSAISSVSITVNKATPSITWATPAAISYGTALSAIQLNATSGTAGGFVYTPALGTELPAGTHTLSVSFTPTDAANYNPATSSVSITVDKATPSVTWATPAAIGYGTALSATQLNATASTPGAFVYTPALGTTLPVGTHTLGVSFTPTDAVNYNPATSSVSLTVNKATPSITWLTPAAISYGTALSATQLNATAGTPGAFAYTPALGTVLAVGTHTLAVSFTPTDAANYSPATASVSITVNPIQPSITWTAPAAISYGTALSATQLNATASVAGTFTYAPAAGTVLGAGSRTLSTTFTPTDTANYGGVSASTTLVVNKLATTVAITQTSPVTVTIGSGATVTLRAAVSSTFGSPTGTVIFNDGSTAIGTGTIAAGIAAITTTFTGIGVHPITAVYSGDGNYNTSTSGVFLETVVAVGLNFVATPSTLTIKQGQAGTATITGTPSGGYTGTTNFACSDLPANTTCSFAPSSLTFPGDDKPQSTVITINTRTTTAAAATSSSMRFAAIFALPLIGFALRRRRSLQRALIVLTLGILLLPSTGCGGSNSPGGSTGGTSGGSGVAPTGTKEITITPTVTAGSNGASSVKLTIVIEP